MANKNPYTPHLVDTSDVELSEELRMLTEELARNVHDIWAAGRMNDGWTYGPERDDTLKHHPCLVDYDGAISKLSMMRSIGKAHTPILLTKKEKECLAEVEHNRWNVEKLLNGWEPAPMNIGKTLFSHDKIVPFTLLNEETKNKDFEQIEVVVNQLNMRGKKYN